MGAYTRYMGVPCCANTLLLDDILRRKWGFKGYVVSDCGAIEDIYVGHKFSKDAPAACAIAVKAGCDLTCGEEYVALNDAVKNHLITEKEIDVSVRRLMLARMKLGLFDPQDKVPYSDIPFSFVDSKDNRELALQIAREGIVLLKNSKNTLPLDKNKVKTIAVLGPNADDVKVLYGNYNSTPSKAVSLLEGLKAKFGDKNVNYTKGCDLVIPEFTGVPIPANIYKGGIKGEYFNNMNCEGRTGISTH